MTTPSAYAFGVCVLSHPSTSGSRLLGLGAAQPRAVLESDALGAQFGKPAGWVQARTGITRLRRVVAAGELASLALTAADAALMRAGVNEEEVDLVVTASCTEASGPWHSGSFLRGLAPRAGRLQVNSVCSGFTYALGAANDLISSGAAQRVLVVAADQMSAIIDPSDLGTSILFGDGAGAAVVGVAGEAGPGIGPTVWGSDGSLAHMISCDEASGGMLRMAGRAVFRWAVEKMPAVALEACARAGIRIADVDVFVPHQANQRIITAIAERLGLGDATVADHITTAGNTSAASIPMALCHLMAEGRARSGQLALLLGFGAGLAWSGQVIRLP